MSQFRTSCLIVLSIFSALTTISCTTPLSANSQNGPGSIECVVFLHGLARSSWSMDDITEAVYEKNYSVANIDYPSRSETVESLAMTAIPEGIRKCREQGAERINFVTHSMGGILLRYYLSQKSIPELGRVVMLSPPNKGSEVVDNIHEYFFFEWQNGPAGQQLGTGPNSLPRQLGPATFPLGIITGDDPAVYDLWMANMIPGPNDGKVSVESARLEGMTDFMVLPVSHTFIMDDDEVIRQTLYFLEHEKFNHPDSNLK
ncbi:alpha/beta fold hydrolase [Desulfosediminicola flagellatus]|uniref:alpha/beta fold hydrolase n=1 Tax=Desulfosediminicola flagellatus TaxID=2569541 RepID=UPI00142F1132|nr:alpha/beta fold hydrolase [Desulfosediminicola flagellatus]